MSAKVEAKKTKTISTAYKQIVPPTNNICRDFNICKGCKRLIRRSIFDEEIPGTDDVKPTFSVHCELDYDPTIFSMAGIIGLSKTVTKDNISAWNKLEVPKGCNRKMEYTILTQGDIKDERKRKD